MLPGAHELGQWDVLRDVEEDAVSYKCCYSVVATRTRPNMAVYSVLPALSQVMQAKAIRLDRHQTNRHKLSTPKATTITKKKTKLTFNQLLLIRPLAQPLLQIIRSTLPLKLSLLSLQRRRSIGVEQDMAVLEVLLVRASLQVLLQAVATVGGGDGRDVHAFGRGAEGGGAVGHCCVGLFGWLSWWE